MDRGVIKDIRSKCGFTQKEFAVYFNIPVGTVRNWEQGISSCPVYVLELIIFRLKHDKIIKSSSD